MTQYMIQKIERAALKMALDEIRKWSDKGIPRAYSCRDLVDLMPPEVIQMLFDMATVGAREENGSTSPDALCYIVDNDTAFGA